MSADSWLLLLYSLPRKRSAERISLWRKLKKFGALQLKNSAYVLPDEPRHFERFQWLMKQARDNRGDATLIRVTQIEGLTNTQIAEQFNDAQANDYRELISALKAFIKRNQSKRSGSYQSDFEKLSFKFKEIRG